jgi:hypothetical protein
MIEDLSPAVHQAMLEKAHRRAVEEVMRADISDVERIARVLAMEAEFLGHMERLRALHQSQPAPRQDNDADSRD